jgi:hypothetical protein
MVTVGRIGRTLTFLSFVTLGACGSDPVAPTVPETVAPGDTQWRSIAAQVARGSNPTSPTRSLTCHTEGVPELHRDRWNCPVEHTLSCAGGGSVAVSGTIAGLCEADGCRARMVRAEMSTVQTYEGCRTTAGITLTGSSTTSGTVDLYFRDAASHAAHWIVKGNLAWSYGGASGICALELTATSMIPSASGTATGSACGTAVDVSY